MFYHKTEKRNKALYEISTQGAFNIFYKSISGNISPVLI